MKPLYFYLLTLTLILNVSCNRPKSETTKSVKSEEQQIINKWQHLPEIDYSSINKPLIEDHSLTPLIEMDVQGAIKINAQVVDLNEVYHLIDSLINAPSENQGKPLTLHLSIHKETSMRFVSPLLEELRSGRYQKVNFINFKGDSFIHRLSLSTKERKSKFKKKGPPPPPPMPGSNSKSSNCTCCPEGDRYFTKSVKGKAQFYDNIVDCLENHMNTENLITITGTAGTIKLNKQEIQKVTLFDQLEKAYVQKNNYQKTVIAIHIDKDCTYKDYVLAISSSVGIIHKSRNTMAMETFNMPFNQLNKSQQTKIRNAIPLMLSEG